MTEKKSPKISEKLQAMTRDAVSRLPNQEKIGPITDLEDVVLDMGPHPNTNKIMEYRLIAKKCRVYSSKEYITSDRRVCTSIWGIEFYKPYVGVSWDKGEYIEPQTFYFKPFFDHEGESRLSYETNVNRGLPESFFRSVTKLKSKSLAQSVLLQEPFTTLSGLKKCGSSFDRYTLLVSEEPDFYQELLDTAMARLITRQAEVNNIKARVYNLGHN